MKMDELRLEARKLPALGDIRGHGEGSTIVIDVAVRESPEWCRYVDAVRQAVGRGADVRWVRRG